MSSGKILRGFSSRQPVPPQRSVGEGSPPGELGRDTTFKICLPRVRVAVRAPDLREALRGVRCALNGVGKSQVAGLLEIAHRPLFLTANDWQITNFIPIKNSKGC